MAEQLSRWRQPGWGNYKRASKPPPAATKEGGRRKKKVWPLLLLFAPSNCPLNRSIFALPPDRRLCETNSLGIFRKLQSQSTRGLYRSRSASPGFSRRQPAIRSTAPLVPAHTEASCRGAASELQSWQLGGTSGVVTAQAHTLLGRDETEAIITNTNIGLHLNSPQPTHDRTKNLSSLFFVQRPLSCLCSNVDLTSFHLFFFWCCPIRLFVLKNPLRASISQIHHADATWRHLARHEHETRLPNLTRHHKPSSTTQQPLHFPFFQYLQYPISAE
ncbi:hypothetical protein HDV62DRAFT_224907 [Trichoderma sp. SZMC 28011]